MWNSYFMDFTTAYLLDSVNDDSKKISYAASFGVDDINEGMEVNISLFDGAVRCKLAEVKIRRN